MTVKELKEELSFYDDDTEVTFQIDSDIECDSWTENKWGNKSVHVEQDLKICFMGEVLGDLNIEMVVDE